MVPGAAARKEELLCERRSMWADLDPCFQADATAAAAGGDEYVRKAELGNKCGWWCWWGRRRRRRWRRRTKHLLLSVVARKIQPTQSRLVWRSATRVYFLAFRHGKFTVLGLAIVGCCGALLLWLLWVAEEEIREMGCGSTWNPGGCQESPWLWWSSQDCWQMGSGCERWVFQATTHVEAAGEEGKGAGGETSSCSWCLLQKRLVELWSPKLREEFR